MSLLVVTGVLPSLLSRLSVYAVSISFLSSDRLLNHYTIDQIVRVSVQLLEIFELQYWRHAIEPYPRQ